MTPTTLSGYTKTYYQYDAVNVFMNAPGKQKTTIMTASTCMNTVINMKKLPYDQALFLETQKARAIRTQPLLETLYTLLLKIKGVAIAPVYEEELINLLKRGELFKEKRALRRKGLPCSCHSNSAHLWVKNKRSLAIITGYALSSDGIWRQHTWLQRKSDERLIETTEPRIAYYGYKLTDTESKCFAILNGDQP